jgi:hypothetical protein
MKIADFSKVLADDSKPFYLLIGDASDVTNGVWALERSKQGAFAVLGLRGQKMRTKEALLDEISAALQFPFYFGEHWDALEECINDLSWLEKSGYVLTIYNSNLLLSKSPDREALLAVFFRTLQSSVVRWGKAIERGESYDRPARLFRVLFHVDAECADGFQEVVFRHGVYVDKLKLEEAVARQL